MPTSFTVPPAIVAEIRELMADPLGQVFRKVWQIGGTS